jgi:hypothetical protein
MEAGKVVKHIFLLQYPAKEYEADGPLERVSALYICDDDICTGV